MTVTTIDPKALLEGRTVSTLTDLAPGSEVMVGPAFFPKPNFGPVVQSPVKCSPDKVGMWQHWPTQFPYMDVCALWNGTVWSGALGEIQKMALPGQSRYLGQTPCGLRTGNQLWPDPAVVCDGLGAALTSDRYFGETIPLIGVDIDPNSEMVTKRTRVTIELWDCPAEMLLVKNSVSPGCDYHIHGSGNASRVHGNRPLVIQQGPGDNRYFFYNCESQGQLLRCEGMGSGPYPQAFGAAKCLSLLSDAGAVYCAGRGRDVQGGLEGSDLQVSRLPRLSQVVGWGTCSFYADDGASGLNPGRIAGTGFEFGMVVGGGSDIDGTQVTGTPWVEDRSAWAQLKDWHGVPSRPWNVRTVTP